MKHLLVCFLGAFLISCTDRAPKPEPVVAEQSRPVYSTSSLVLAEPVPGKKLKISISTKDSSLYIVNCNEHIVVSVLTNNSTVPAWGGASNACLSQSIIIPRGSTLSFIVTLPDLETDTVYTARVGGIHQGPDVRSPQYAPELTLSNEFKLLP
ncbi:hypothetical protein SAMN05421546_0016 [Solilutibacter tolerans]|uniref:Uncharacterized protein n=1 Tax=Solilutibacter tolerans TaxID=1604334 RepID=A0A1N6YMA2_9GAMM|nr:hypothetical protein SAMN05421546_0016 [Lysobacter tolerans]